MSLRVSSVRFSPADISLQRTGLLGWCSFLIDGCLRIEGVAVRRTQQGRRTLAYPAKDDGWARRWHYVYPINDATRIAVERQVLAEIDLDREAAR